MKSKKLKIVLALNEENTLYKRAIGDMLLMLVTGKPITIPRYAIKDEDVHLLFRQIYNLLNDKKTDSTIQPGENG